MEYTSELAVIRAKNNKIQSPFGSSAWEAIKSVIKQFITTTKFWLPILFYVIILSVFATAQLYIDDISNNVQGDLFYTVSFSLILFMSVLFSLMTAPFVFRSMWTFDKPVSEQIGIHSYWGLIFGKYIGMLSLYLFFGFLLSLSTFSIDSLFTLGDNMIYTFGKSLQAFTFSSLFWLTWGTIFISVGVFFLKEWQTSTFIVGLFAFMFAFIPLQSLTHTNPETSSVVVIENEKVTRKEVVSYNQANSNYFSVYWLVAPFNIFASTTSLLNVFDGNLNNEYNVDTKFETFFSQEQSVLVGDIYYNPIDYSILYPEETKNEWDEMNLANEFGREEIVKNNLDVDIIDGQSYDFLNLIKSSKSETVEEIMNDIGEKIIKLSNKNDYLEKYNDYLNEDFGIEGNVNYGSYSLVNNSFIIPNEFKEGKYLDFVEFVSVYSQSNGIDNETKLILESIANSKERLLNKFYISEFSINDWNVIYNEAAHSIDETIIPYTPVVSNEESNLRKQAHDNGNVGVMNQTLYEVEKGDFISDWIYIVGLLIISFIFFFASVPTIMGRNYF